VKTRGKSFPVYAGTANEKHEWIAHIRRCIAVRCAPPLTMPGCAQELLAKSGKTAATDHAAVWIPDDLAKLCMLCEKTHFSVVQRRHHCRNCGKVVCANCSNRRVLVPSLVDKKPVSAR